MAVSLTNALIERGIRVPEEIAVAGFDSYTGNALNTPTVTAMSDINYNQGIKTVCLLHKRITGEVCEKYELHIEAVETGEAADAANLKAVCLNGIGKSLQNRWNISICFSQAI